MKYNYYDLIQFQLFKPETGYYLVVEETYAGDYGVVDDIDIEACASGDVFVTDIFAPFWRGDR